MFPLIAIAPVCPSASRVSLSLLPLFDVHFEFSLRLIVVHEEEEVCPRSEEVEGVTLVSGTVGLKETVKRVVNFCCENKEK